MQPEPKYGLITGIGLCLWLIAEQRLGFHTTRLEAGEYVTWFSGLIPLVALYFLLQQKQAATAGGRLGLLQGLGSGLRASFIAALIVYTFLVIYSQRVNAGWLDAALDWKVAQMRAAGLAEVEIREEIVFYRQARSPVGLIFTVGAALTLLGGALSLALTLFLRPRPRA